MSPRAEQIAALSLPLEQLPDPLPIPVLERPFDVTVTPPGSKSIANRALLLAALASDTSTLTNVPAGADDVRVMIDALRRLGAAIDVTTSSLDTPGFPLTNATVTVTGVGGQWKIPAGQTVRLNLGGAGTAVRFLTAAAILAPPGTAIEIEGDSRMRDRPISELADALSQLGASAQYLGNLGCPPLRIVPPDDLKSLATRVSFNDPKSSQFISAIMLVAPFLPRMLTIDLHGGVVSEPYIEMTWRLIQRALSVTPVTKHKEGTLSIRIPVCAAAGFNFAVEPDASSAAYFCAAAVLCPKSRMLLAGIPGNPDSSLQGDIEFFQIAKFMGAMVESTNAGTVVRPPPTAIRAISGDFAPTPDTAMTAAVLACFASPAPDNPAAASTLRGLRTLRIKESDRLAALKTELSRLGASVEIIPAADNETLRITPPRHHDTSTRPPPLFRTYSDHRIAMSLALIGLRRPGVSIANPRCVAKSYPTFWRDLARLYS